MMGVDIFMAAYVNKYATLCFGINRSENHICIYERYIKKRVRKMHKR